MPLTRFERTEEAPPHITDRAMNSARTELAALTQGVGKGLHKSVTVGDVERPAGVVNSSHLVVGELERLHEQTSA
jgi:hypothetical protein